MASIEFLFQSLWDSPKDKFTWVNIMKKAEGMHKQEIIDAYDKGEFDCGCNGTGEDYYNKTFKKD